MTTPPTPPNSGPSGLSRQLVFTSSQAAVYLGVSLATIRRWTDAGHISCYRTPGGQRRFSRDQLDSFTASLRRGGHDEQVHTPHTVIGRSGRPIVA
jgi:excisionase family DNA binding protein